MDIIKSIPRFNEYVNEASDRVSRVSYTSSEVCCLLPGWNMGQLDGSHPTSTYYNFNQLCKHFWPSFCLYFLYIEWYDMNNFKILAGSPAGKILLEGRGVDGRAILEWILKK